MNTAPTRQMIVAGGFDVVLAATGAAVNIPDIPGLKDENGKLKPEYMSCLDTCGREPELGKKVIIVGGSEVGTETAMVSVRPGPRCHGADQTEAAGS